MQTATSVAPSTDMWRSLDMRFGARARRTDRRVILIAAAIASLLSGAAHPPVRAAESCPPFDHEHRTWTDLLRRWVSDGQVDYSAWLRDGRPALDTYLAALSATCARDYQAWTREQRLAYWINAYNAFTVDLILDSYPIASIRKIGWLPGAAFREKFIPMPGLKGRTISLNDIEHDTIRADFAEARIHFALVCASRSCPPLRAEAYRGADLDRQLADQARIFLSDASKNRFDAAARTLYLSAIFDWFAADFRAAAGSVQKFVAPYMADPRAAESGVRIEFLDYDWSLNDRSK
jgi:hypothetical protein